MKLDKSKPHSPVHVFTSGGPSTYLSQDGKNFNPATLEEVVPEKPPAPKTPEPNVVRCKLCDKIYKIGNSKKRAVSLMERHIKKEHANQIKE